MDHSLAVYINQSISDFLELPGGIINNSRGKV